LKHPHLESRNKFIAERNQAFFSLDKNKIMEYSKKHCADLEEDVDEEVFWIGVHKSITAITSAPEHIRERSIKWLTDRGYSHF